MGSNTCNPPVIEDIDYYMQKGAPHCDDPVVGAEPAGYAPPLSDKEEEIPLKCYKLNEEEDVVDNKVYINGEGLPPQPTHMTKMQNAVNGIDPDKQNPGIQPGDIETIGSYVLAALIALIIICTIAYYAFLAYSQPHGSFWNFVKKWAFKLPRWWWCPPAPAQ